jgi:hypothetical protein
VVAKQGCSFRYKDFGIIKFPLVVTTAVGVERRSREAAAKRAGGTGTTRPKPVPKKSVAVAKTKKAATPQDEAPVVVTRSRAKKADPVPTLVLGRTVSTSALPPSTPTVETPVMGPPTGIVGSSNVVGRQVAIFLEDLDRLEVPFLGSAPSRVKLEMSREYLITMLNRELLEVDAAREAILRRRTIGRDLLASMNDKISSLGGRLAQLSLAPGEASLGKRAVAREDDDDDDDEVEMEDFGARAGASRDGDAGEEEEEVEDDEEMGGEP